MSVHTHNLSPWQMQKTRLWPCDGKPRFSVKGMGDLTYSQAYDRILAMTGSARDEATKKITFTPEAMRRITDLNSVYYPLAKQFIYDHFIAEHKARVEAQQDKLRREAVAALPPLVTPPANTP